MKDFHSSNLGSNIQRFFKCVSYSFICTWSTKIDTLHIKTSHAFGDFHRIDDFCALR